MKKNYLNTKEVATLFNVNNSTIRRWTLNRKLRCTTSDGGHRKFLYKHILEFIDSHKKELSLNLDGISTLSKESGIAKSIKFITQSALNRNVNEVESIIMRLYLQGKKINEIFDKYIDKSLDSIQSLLEDESISVAEEHIARKTISKSLNNFRNIVRPNTENNKTALCLNLENDVPDLAIDMIQIILEEQNYLVDNAGSHTSVDNIKLLLDKNNYDSIYIYMCSRQCCTATVKENIQNTITSVREIELLCKKLSIELFIGGPGTSYIDKKINLNYTKFLSFTKILEFV